MVPVWRFTRGGSGTWRKYRVPPAVPLPGPNVTPEPSEKIKGLAGTSTVPGIETQPQDALRFRKTPPPAVSGRQLFQAHKTCKPQDTLQIRKTPWHGVTKQPPAVPLPGPNVTPEPNEKIKGLAGTSTVPGTETKPQDTLKMRKTPWHGVTEQPPALNRMKKSRVWQAIVPGTQNKPQDTLQIRKTPWHGVTKQPPAVPLPGQTSLLNRMKKSRAETQPQDALRIRKTPWHSLLSSLCPGQPNEKIKGLAGNCSRHRKQATRHPSNQDETAAVPLPGPNVAPEPNEKIKGLAGSCSGTQNKPRDTLQIRKTPWHGVTKQPPALSRMKKSRVWQAIVPGTQNKPQDILQIRKTPWHGVTKQPPAVPLPGPNVTPEPNEKIKGLAGNCSRHTKQATRHPSNQENTLARRDETASCRIGNYSRHTKQATRHPSNQENTLARRDEAASCRPLPGPNVTPEPNEKIKGLAGNLSRHTKQATRHPSNQENTLARRDETASCRPSARAKRHS